MITTKLDCATQGTDQFEGIDFKVGREHGDRADCAYLRTFHARLSAVPALSTSGNARIHYVCPTCLSEEGREPTPAYPYLYILLLISN